MPKRNEEAKFVLIGRKQDANKRTVKEEVIGYYTDEKVLANDYFYFIDKYQKFVVARIERKPLIKPVTDEELRGLMKG